MLEMDMEDIPIALQGKTEIVFSNIREIFTFHSK